MSRYSAQILICFIAYIFSIFNFSVGLVGNLAELPLCTVPPANCYQNEAAQCSSDNQISQCLAEGQQEETLFIHATELVKLADKIDEICISGKFSVQEPSKWRFLLHTVALCMRKFQECWLFWKLIMLIRSRIWQLPDTCQTGVWKSFSGK